MVQSIIEFFAERKAAWLKAKMKPTLEGPAQAKLLQEAEDKFSLAAWLPDAAKRASQLSIVSHPSKFSHPSSKTSPIIAKSKQRNDGYLRSGNTEYQLDVFGNAAAMDVYKFLSLQMTDGRTILDHLEEDSDVIRNIFTIPTASYEDLKQGLISIRQTSHLSKTDPLVKQVYFPVEGSYHLLSILTPSGLLTELKNRIEDIRFSEASKPARECRKKNEYHSVGYDELLNLTITAYGGTQPQNVSVLNSRNAGRACLLPCTPPVLKKRQIKLPAQSFFKDTLRIKLFKVDFHSLHKRMKEDINNIRVRTAINNRINSIIAQVLENVFKVRLTGGEGWSKSEYYASLPLAQRIWLDDAYLSQRENEEEWIEEITDSFAQWIIKAYEYLLQNNSIKFSDDELQHIRQFVLEAVNQDKEFLK